MNPTLLDLTERLVPISDFSQGKAGKIFNDVAILLHDDCGNCADSDAVCIQSPSAVE